MRDELPARARAGRWVVTADHCFGRILLDSAVGGCWYDVLDRRRGAGPAYRQLDDAQLAEAVDLGRRLLTEGDVLLRSLNQQSLEWRGKTATAPRRPIPVESPGRSPRRA